MGVRRVIFRNRKSLGFNILANTAKSFTLSSSAKNILYYGGLAAVVLGGALFNVIDQSTEKTPYEIAVENGFVGTQEELADLLKEEGFQVTQATVSRDIKELALIKVTYGEDQYRYSLPTEVTVSEARLRFMLKEFVLNYAASSNILVVRTAPGNANAVASALDNAQWAEILGSVAGDDTILIVARKPEEIPLLIDKLESYLD